MTDELVPSQRITEVDRAAGRIRFPNGSKRIFPEVPSIVDVEIEGKRVSCRWNPRNGPDRSRSGVLFVGKSWATSRALSVDRLHIRRSGSRYLIET